MSDAAGPEGRGGQAPAVPWAAAEEERVPEAFRPWLDAWLAPEQAADGSAALAAALRALAAALRPEGLERRGAFDLLAADALVTRACEAAAAEADPGAALEHVLERVARAAP